MELKTLLLGNTGELGSAIKNSNYFPPLLTPPKKELDITKIETIKKYFEKNNFDSIINCSALARMKMCQENPSEAINVNIIGTSNLINCVFSRCIVLL